jgi:hypothetical protein
MSRTVWKSVVRTSALEYVTTIGGQSPSRPWLPAWQRIVMWAVAAFLFVSLFCEYGQGW